MDFDDLFDNFSWYGKSQYSADSSSYQKLTAAD